jgi:hypothetical protein
MRFTFLRLTILMCIGAVALGPSGVLAHGGDHTSPIQTFTQAIGPYDVTMMVELPEAVPSPLFVNIAPPDDIGTATILLRAAPRGYSFDEAPRTEVQTTPGPQGLYYAELAVDRAGEWIIEARVDGPQGVGVAYIPFTITLATLPPYSVPLFAGLGTLVLLMLTNIVLAGVFGRRKQPLPPWITSATSHAMVACVVVTAIFGALQYTTTAQRASAAGATTLPIYGRPHIVMNLETTLSTLTAGQPVTLTLNLTDGGSGLPVDDIVPHHEALVHLIIINDDGSFFAHEHPAQVAIGRYTITFTPDQPGRYTAYAEISRRESGTQLVTADVTIYGEAVSRTAQVAPGLGERAVAGMQVDVQASSPIVQAGKQTTLTFTFSADDAPVIDLQPWLGMAGHLMVRHANGALAHTHAAEQAPPSEPVLALGTRYGPTIRFVYTFPQPGRYQLWAQFKRAGQIVTVPITIEAQP